MHPTRVCDSLATLPSAAPVQWCTPKAYPLGTALLEGICYQYPTLYHCWNLSSNFHYLDLAVYSIHCCSPTSCCKSLVVFGVLVLSPIITLHLLTPRSCRFDGKTDSGLVRLAMPTDLVKLLLMVLTAKSTSLHPSVTLGTATSTMDPAYAMKLASVFRLATLFGLMVPSGVVDGRI